MGFLDNLERGIEKAVRTAFSTGSRRRIEAVEIASALRRELDEHSFTISAGRTMAPNDFIVEFSEEDFPRAQEWGAPLAEELCEVVIKHARSQAYTLQGSVRVSFTRSPDLERGRFEIISSARRTTSEDAAPRPSAAREAPRPAAAPEQPARGQWEPPHSTPEHWVPVLDIDGQRLSIEADSIILGRSAAADITVEDTGVSRQHLEIRREGEHWLAVDLGSTNGSLVDGQRLRGRTELVNGAVIEMGRTRIIFRLVAPRRNRKNV